MAAAEPTSLVFVSVPVPDQSAAARNRAVVQGLDIVLVRLTGQRNPVADSIRGQAQRYLLQYSYETRSIRSEQDRGVMRQQLFLDLRFDSRVLSEDIVSNGLPVWGDERPETLLWLIVEDEASSRQIAQDGADNAMADALDQVATARGITLVRPLFDLEDQAVVTASDLWAQFEQPIRDASTRYRPDVVLTARVARITANQWQARWLRLDPLGTSGWVTEADSAEQAVIEGIDILTDAFAGNFAVQSGDLSSGLQVMVRGVNDITDYARVMKHLQDLTVVQEVILLQASGEDLILAVTARGGREAISRALALDAMLMRVEEPTFGEVVADPMLVLDLRP